MKCGPDTLLTKLQDTDMESKLSVKVGDLVKMQRGYSQGGLLIEFVEVDPAVKYRWCRVLWPDVGNSMEKVRDLEKIR